MYTQCFCFRPFDLSFNQFHKFINGKLLLDLNIFNMRKRHNAVMLSQLRP